MSPLSAGADQSPAISIAEEEETAVIAEEGGGEASKLKTLLSLMRKVANVKVGDSYQSSHILGSDLMLRISQI